MKHPKIFLMIVTMMALAGCVPSPWEAWLYEHKMDFGLQSGIYLPPKPINFLDQYVGGAFVSVGVVAHNRTTRSGDPPYELGVSVKSILLEHQRVTFHSVSIRSSLGKIYVVHPISTESMTGRKIARVEFPVSREFKRAGIPKAAEQGIIQAHLRTDKSIELQPDENETIEVMVDIEVFTSDSSERKVVAYEFFPRKDSGFFIGISV